jgi:hypothetical protein
MTQNQLVRPQLAGILLTALMVVMLTSPQTAIGAATTALVTINAPMASTAKLTLTPTAISFPDSDPNTVPSIPANSAVTASVNAKTNAGMTITLSVLAQGDLVSGSNTIPINNITWTATGTGFISGTMNKTTSQLAGQWTTSVNSTGTFSYRLANSWSYATGNYTQTVTYTLTAP